MRLMVAQSKAIELSRSFFFSKEKETENPSDIKGHGVPAWIKNKMESRQVSPRSLYEALGSTSITPQDKNLLSCSSLRKE